MHTHDGFELREAAERGAGVFTSRAFRTGDTVMIGVIKEILDRNNSHALQLGRNHFVLFEGLAGFVNHSCDPNCGIRVNETGAHDYVAMKNIRAGDEITFDYAMQNASVDYFPKQCICGAGACRGEITGWKGLPDHRRQDYAGFVAPYLLELDA